MHSYHHLPTRKCVFLERVLPENLTVRLPIRTSSKQASSVLEIRMIIAAQLTFRSCLVPVHGDLMLHEVSVEIKFSILTH